jgi:hypothetical protein
MFLSFFFFFLNENSYHLILLYLLQGMGYYMLVTSICVAALYHISSCPTTRISPWYPPQQIPPPCNCIFWLVRGDPFIFLS